MENASEAIYIGVYTTIFVIALSITIFLFSSLMSYTDEAYDYMHAQSNDAVLVTGEVNRHLVLNSNDVISYYYNYIKRDLYSESNLDNSVVVNINLNTRNETPVMLENTNLSYKDVVNKIGKNNKYILTVDERTNDNTTYINIIKATDEELQELW